MSEFFYRYGAILILLGFMLFYSSIAYAGLYIALSEYAAVLSPQVDGRPLAKSRRKLVRASWVGVIVGLLMVLGGYAALAERVGEVFLLRMPKEERVVVTKTIIILALMYPAIKTLRSLRSDYLTYRKTTNFRIWARGVPGNGISAAHMNYFLGWRHRAIGDALSTTAMYGLITLVVLVATQGERPIERPDWMRMGAVFAATITVSVLRRIVLHVRVVLRPESGLADLCTNPPVLREHRKPERHESRFRLYRPGSWRDQDHEDSFKIASLIEWSVRRAQGRFAQHDYEKIVLAARRLAQSLRLKALQARTDKDTGAVYEERKFLALQLTTSRNPMYFVERIAEVTEGEPEPPELPRRRAARFVEAFSSSISLHWPTVKIVGLALAIIVFLVLGRLADAVGLLK